MADSETHKVNPRVEVSVGDGSSSVTRSADDGSFEEHDGSLEVEIERKPKAEPEAPEGEVAEAPEATEDAAEETESEEPSEGELPEFDAENEEVVAQYDKKYFTEDGKFDLRVVTEQFYTTDKKLPDDFFKYIELRQGVDRATAESILASLDAQQEANQQAFFEKHGGQEAYTTAFEWCKANYTDAQKAAFNAAADKGGDAFDDAVTAMFARYSKANPPKSEPKVPPRRSASPKKDATASSVADKGGSNAAGFKSDAEYRAALRAAGTDRIKVAEVVAKLRASKF